MPVHSLVPIASSSHGWLTARVSNNARPLPAHSNVTGIVTAGLARRSSRPSSSSRSKPSNVILCDVASTNGTS